MRQVTGELFLGLVATLGILVFILYAGGNLEERQNQKARQENARAIENGAALYTSHCRSCHGVNGEGVGELGPALHEASFFTDRLDEIGWVGTMQEYLEGTISMGRITATRPLYTGNGAVVMNAWANDYGGPLRPDEIRDLAIFIENWEASASGAVELEILVVPTSVIQSGDPTQGKSLFLESGCSNCHTIQGLSSSESGPDLSKVGALAASRVSGASAEAYLRESFLIPNAYIVEGYTSGSGCGGILTENQLDHLIAFLLTLK